MYPKFGIYEVKVSPKCRQLFVISASLSSRPRSGPSQDSLKGVELFGTFYVKREKNKTIRRAVDPPSRCDRVFITQITQVWSQRRRKESSFFQQRKVHTMGNFKLESTNFSLIRDQKVQICLLNP